MQETSTFISDELNRLAAADESGQKSLGYQHTLREIMQQPDTWAATCDIAAASQGHLQWAVEGIQSIVLTGSGSSQFVGECVRLGLQQKFGVAVQVTGGGALLTHRRYEIPSSGPALMISFARSGNSPESTAVVARTLETCPEIRHLVITCNRLGKLALEYQDHPRVRVVVLDDRTNDRSLVMTSSFTNMVLATDALISVHEPLEHRRECDKLVGMCRGLLSSSGSEIARVARLPFRRAVFLGSGSRFGAALESALKMLEMSAGRVATMSETYLGLRHGPMSYIDPETLVVCFLSSDPAVRAYEADLIAELNQKKLGLSKLFFGARIPAHLVKSSDGVIESGGVPGQGDHRAPVLEAVVGQLLAFFRCLEEGLQPDSPSAAGVINRVVADFPLHTVDS